MEKIPYQKWVNALRSGDYRQTRERLKGILPDGGTGYCCIGVLADVMGYQDLYSYEGELIIYKGVRSNIGDDGLNNLIRYNDEDRKSFSEIADYIERELISDD